MAAIATVTGTALVPGVSRNKRLYTADLIERTAQRAQARLATEGGAPLTMRVAHPEKASTAPVTEIVGRVTRVWTEADGRLRFAADLADTPAARDVATLIDPAGGPYVRGVSIRGKWVGEARKVVFGGETVDTADDLELDGIDFTHDPGVSGAGVEQYQAGTPGRAREAAEDDRLIFESVQEALVETIVEAADAAAKEPYGDVVYADPGYQKDKKKRYPLDTKRHAKAAWSYVSQDDNARLYTANQLKRIKGRIVKALKRFGVQVAAQEGWLIEPASAVSESLTEALPYDYGDGQRPASFNVTLDNGMVCVTVSSWCIDPHDLDAVGRAAMAGACAALAALDDDADGDIDVPGAPAEDNDRDNDMEATAEAEAAPDPSPDTAGASAPVSPAAESAADHNPDEEEPAVSEPTTQAVEATQATATPAPGPAPVVTFSPDQFAQLLERIGPRVAESAPAAPAATTEAAPAAEKPAEAAPVAESEEARIARLVETQVAAARTQIVQELATSGQGPARKGLVESAATDTDGTPAASNGYGYPEGWPNKPMHQFTAEERKQYMGASLVGAVLKGRGGAQSA